MSADREDAGSVQEILERFGPGDDVPWVYVQKLLDLLATAQGGEAKNERLSSAQNAGRQDGSWCDYCTPRRLYHRTDCPRQGSM